MFCLKNNHGYKYKQEPDHSGEITTGVTYEVEGVW